MKKNDKLVVVVGVVILVIAAVGVYYWVPEELEVGTADVDDFVGISGVFKDDLPSSIVVSDGCPFYALIATPLAVHYDVDCG